MEGFPTSYHRRWYIAKNWKLLTHTFYRRKFTRSGSWSLRALRHESDCGPLWGKHFTTQQIFSLEISGPKVVLLCKFSLYRAVRAPIGAQALRLQPHGWSGPEVYAYLQPLLRSAQCAPKATEFGGITQNIGQLRWRSFEVTDFDTNQKLIFDFLLVINTNLPRVLHRFRVIAFNMCKSAIFGYPCCVNLSNPPCYGMVGYKHPSAVRCSPIAKRFVCWNNVTQTKNIHETHDVWCTCQWLKVNYNVGQCPTWWPPCRIRPLLNAAKLGWRPLLECHAVTLPIRESCWN